MLVADLAYFGHLDSEFLCQHEGLRTIQRQLPVRFIRVIENGVHQIFTVHLYYSIRIYRDMHGSTYPFGPITASKNRSVNINLQSLETENLYMPRRRPLQIDFLLNKVRHCADKSIGDCQ